MPEEREIGLRGPRTPASKSKVGKKGMAKKTVKKAAKKAAKKAGKKAAKKK